MKPSADVIWLIEHIHYNNQGELEWADDTRSKEIHVLEIDIYINLYLLLGCLLSFIIYLCQHFCFSLLL